MTYFTYGEIEAARLTGRRRYRQGWFGKKILQVEIEHPKPTYPNPPPPPGTPYDAWRSGSFTFWRDATQFDVATIDGFQSAARENTQHVRACICHEHNPVCQCEQAA